MGEKEERLNKNIIFKQVTEIIECQENYGYEDKGLLKKGANMALEQMAINLIHREFALEFIAEMTGIHLNRVKQMEKNYWIKKGIEIAEKNIAKVLLSHGFDHEFIYNELAIK